MKESRLIIIFSAALAFITTIFAIIMNNMCPNLLDYVGIITNIYCGIIVGLVTSIVQYFVQKRKIINIVYGAYFDIYRSYYYVKNNSFLFHYNVYSVYKKILELNPKIVDALDEYHGIFKKHDKLYKKLNPSIPLLESYKRKNILKSFIYLFNGKQMKETLEPLILEIENILNSINKKRFLQDKKDMVRMHDFVYK